MQELEDYDECYVAQSPLVISYSELSPIFPQKPPAIIDPLALGFKTSVKMEKEQNENDLNVARLVLLQNLMGRIYQDWSTSAKDDFNDVPSRRSSLKSEDGNDNIQPESTNEVIAKVASAERTISPKKSAFDLATSYQSHSKATNFTIADTNIQIETIEDQIDSVEVMILPPLPPPKEDFKLKEDCKSLEMKSSETLIDSNHEILPDPPVEEISISTSPALNEKQAAHDINALQQINSPEKKDTKVPPPKRLNFPIKKPRHPAPSENTNSIIDDGALDYIDSAASVNIVQAYTKKFYLPRKPVIPKRSSSIKLEIRTSRLDDVTFMTGDSRDPASPTSDSLPSPRTESEASPRSARSFVAESPVAGQLSASSVQSFGGSCASPNSSRSKISALKKIGQKVSGFLRKSAPPSPPKRTQYVARFPVSLDSVTFKNSDPDSRIEYIKASSSTYIRNQNSGRPGHKRRPSKLGILHDALVIPTRSSSNGLSFSEDVFKSSGIAV